MIKSFGISLRAVFLALAVLLGMTAAANAQCLNSQQTKVAIQQKQVVNIRQALKRAGLKGVRVVKAELCPPNYIVTVLDKKGNLRTHRIRATR